MLSTPSLGITENELAIIISCLDPQLSTPSLGITGLYLNCWLQIAHRFFQLPLSGSPSPIPGFSGSPRLPAAAPLRTSVFSGHYLKI